MSRRTLRTLLAISLGALGAGAIIVWDVGRTVDRAIRAIGR